MTGRRYRILDVFTDTAFAGNPLAVVLDAAGLDGAAMQKIANEFNLSETVFVLPPQDGRHTASIRIFTPHFELPFAGHPTVGAAATLAEAVDGIPRIVVLEETIGPVRCAVSREGGRIFAEFGLPRLPEPLDQQAEPAAIAAALGLDPGDVGFENHCVTAWSAGVPYVCVPVDGLASLARAALDRKLWVETVGTGTSSPGAYIYCRRAGSGQGGFRARMLAGHLGLVEDPATGSAAAAFAGAVMRFDAPRDGTNAMIIEQGVEMGRPSRIRLELDVVNSALLRARIGGHVAAVAEGILAA